MSPFRLDLLTGKVALVTGGGSGIGRGVALAFAAHGASVAVMGRKRENLDETVALIEEAGGRALAVPADVRKPEEVDAAIAAIVATFGGLDIVVNGAAGNFLAPIVGMSTNAFRTVVDIDLVGTFNVSKAAQPHLAKKGGAIVNLSATLQYLGTPLMAHAAAAKAGVDSFTRTCAVEWGSLNIRVNGIAPGPIGDTEGARRLMPGDVAAKIESRVPLGRLGAIEDVALAAVFLASDASAWTTGAILVVDGGAWLASGRIDL